MLLTPDRTRTPDDLHRGGTGAEAPRQGAEAELSGGGRPHLRRDPRGRPRGPLGRRSDRLRLDHPDHRRRDAGRRRDDAHDPGRRRLSRRHQARHRARADPSRRRRRSRRAGAGRDPSPRTATSSSTPAGRRPTLTVRQHRRPAGADRQPFPFLRGQQGARLRSRRSLRHAARHSRRHRGALRAGADEGGDAGRRSAARRELAGLNALTNGSALDEAGRQAALARARAAGFKGA